MDDAWPAGLPRTIDYPAVGVDAVVAGAARAYADRVALVDGTQSLTFCQLAELVGRVAGGLRARGIGAGDHVLIHLPNSLWYPAVYYGILASGAAAAPVNPAQPAPALRRQMDELGVVAAFTHPQCAANLSAAGTDGLRLVVTVAGTAAAPAGEGGSAPASGTGEATDNGGEAGPAGAVPFDALLDPEPLVGVRSSPYALAHLQLTGGTTGRSKGVRVLHRNVVAHVLQAAAWRGGHLPEPDALGGIRLRPVGTADRFPLRPGAGSVITVAPMFHGLALIGHTFNVLMGFTVVLPGRFQPASYLAEVERHRAVSLTGVPAFSQALLGSPGIEAHDLSSVRVVQTGGGPIDSATKARLAARLPQAVVTESYGLSEATGTLVATVCDRVDLNPFGTVGRPVSDVQIQIRADDGVTIVDTGGIGEIWARGPQITAGYHNDPELTARQFADGWLRTGDLGRVDEQGFLFLAGRAKDMIIYKGYNVYPLHLEEILAGHPDVAQVAVVGAVDPSAGEVPVAFVVPRAGADRATLPADLLTYVDERVAPYQRVREIVLTDELPLSATGKVLKTALRERLR